MKTLLFSSALVGGFFAAVSAHAGSFQFHEDFEGRAESAPVEAAGWSLVTDTAAPQSVSAAFSVDDDMNVVKLTAVNDGVSQFTSAYFFHEHDIAAGESVLQGNLYGQDAGDFLFTTAQPAVKFGGNGIDVRGAVFSVDCQLGSGFFFVVVLADGSRYAVADAEFDPDPGTVSTVSSNPVDPATTEFRRILHAGGAPGQRLRLADTPGFLSDAQLSGVREVGLYVRPVSAGAPSRFDNFRLTDYDVVLPPTATISHVRTGTVFLDDGQPDAFAESFTTGVPKFSPSTGQLTGVTLALEAEWSGSYSFVNETGGEAGQVRYTPHPVVWAQTRLPDVSTVQAETTAAARLQPFAAGGGGTAQDNASGTLSQSTQLSPAEFAQFTGSGSTTLDVEIRDDSLYEILSTTPDLGTISKMMSADFTLTITYTYVPAAPSAGVIFVDADATGAADGSSWADAFPRLEDAIAAAAPGNEIWVAEGTYHPAPPGGDRTASFSMRGGVSWFGGFAGTETMRAQRDPLAHPTILSGDLDENDGGGTGPDARWFNMSDNSHQVVTASNLRLPAVIDGFTITRGSGSNTFSGAGISMVMCEDILVANCKIIGNISSNAAGMLTLATRARVLSCHFEDNYAFDGRGGAIYHGGDWQDASTSYLLTIHDTSFRANLAAVGASSGNAGAIWSDFRAPVEIDRCLFENNEAKWRFANGQFAAGGGAMLVFGEGSRIANSVFRGNRAHIGGALWLGRETTIANCLFTHNEAYRQSSGFYDYGGYAGAIYAPGSASSGTSRIDHCTFHANTARNVGGIWGNPSLVIINSILFTNTLTETDATPLDQQLSGDPVIRHSCVKGLPDPQDGNIAIDPVFADPNGPDDIPGNSDDNLRPGNGSPCIDSGDNSAFPAGMGAVDLAGGARFLDDPATPDTGVGTPPITDMGAYEFIPGSGSGGDNQLPTASFTYSVADNTVSFTDTSTDADGTLTQWIWNFGDGTSSTLQNPVHTYSANGTYQVTLTVRDDANGTDRGPAVAVSVSGLVTGSVSITAPAENATVSGTVTVTVATTPDIVRVKLYIDGVYTNLKDTAPPFQIDWDSTSVADGPHTIEIKGNDATDTDAGVFWSAPVHIVVHNAPPPTPLESWRSQYFTAAQLADPAMEAAVWGTGADFDHDGLVNDAEFALGTDPTNPRDGNGGITLALVEENGRTLLSLTFRRRNDDPNLVTQAQISHDLVHWTSAPSSIQTLSVLDQGNGYEIVTIKEVPSPAPHSAAFARLSIQRTGP